MNLYPQTKNTCIPSDRLASAGINVPCRNNMQCLAGHTNINCQHKISKTTSNTGRFLSIEEVVDVKSVLAWNISQNMPPLPPVEVKYLSERKTI